MCEHLKDGYILLPYQKLGYRTNLRFFCCKLAQYLFIYNIYVLYKHYSSLKLGAVYILCQPKWGVQTTHC